MLLTRRISIVLGSLLVGCLLLFLATKEWGFTSETQATISGEYKLPEFETSNPQFCFWQFPGSKKHRVLVVADGKYLFVDRNGNHDLTEADERVLSTKNEYSPDRSFVFNIGKISVAGATHVMTELTIHPLEYAGRDNAKIKQLLDKDPQANSYLLSSQIQTERFHGSGLNGRVPVLVGSTDLDGVLQFGKTIETAPTIDLLGDLEIRLYSKIKLRPGSQPDITTVVGTPGTAPGIFAMISYEDVIPEVYPSLKLRVTSGENGKSEELDVELKRRC